MPGLIRTPLGSQWTEKIYNSLNQKPSAKTLTIFVDLKKEKKQWGWGGGPHTKMCQNFVTFWYSIDFPGGSELTQASEGPLKGVKMTVMDILRFRDINMRTLPTQISDILSFLNRGAYMPPPGLIRVKVNKIFQSGIIEKLI